MLTLKSRTLNPARCIRAAIDLELHAAALYEGLAARFTSLPWLRDLLLGLSEEERQHAMRIRMLDRLHPGAIWAREDLGPVSRALQAALGRLIELEEMAQRACPLSPARILDAVAGLESDAGGIHAEMMARTMAPQVRELFESLASQDRHHDEVLRRARERLEAPRPGGAIPAGPARIR